MYNVIFKKGSDQSFEKMEEFCPAYISEVQLLAEDEGLILQSRSIMIRS